MIDAQLLKIFAIALICVSVGAIVRIVKGELSFAVSVAGILVVFGVVILSVEGLLREVTEILNTGGFSEYVEILIKALGVAILTHIAASVCKGCGEVSIAGAVEFAGKAEILLLSLPMIEKLLKYTAEIASLGAR